MCDNWDEPIGDFQIKVGDRVGAYKCFGEDETFYLFGYGVYEGMHVPHRSYDCTEPDQNEDVPREPNPRIRLDSGQIVYGCECWWGPEDKMKKIESLYNTVYVDIDEEIEKFRREYKGFRILSEEEAAEMDFPYPPEPEWEED
jgi:hypothetical protein